MNSSLLDVTVLTDSKSVLTKQKLKSYVALYRAANPHVGQQAAYNHLSKLGGFHSWNHLSARLKNGEELQDPFRKI